MTKTYQKMCLFPKKIYYHIFVYKFGFAIKYFHEKDTCYSCSNKSVKQAIKMLKQNEVCSIFTVKSFKVIPIKVMIILFHTALYNWFQFNKRPIMLTCEEFLRQKTP